MTFTYNGPVDNPGIVRFYLDDTVQDDGPRPGKANFSDEEINYLLSGGVTVVQAIARGMTQLSSSWSSYAVTEKGKTLDFDAKDVASNWAQRKRDILEDGIDEIMTFGPVDLEKIDP